MSLRKHLALTSLIPGAALGISLYSVPEKYRGHLPHNIDVASMAGNIAPGLALGLMASFVFEKASRISRIYGALAVLALSGGMNMLAESPVGHSQMPNELTIVLGNGVGGELRDFISGVLATALCLLPLTCSKEPLVDKTLASVTVD